MCSKNNAQSNVSFLKLLILEYCIIDNYGAHMLALWQGGEIELSGTQHCCSLVTPTPAEWVKIGKLGAQAIAILLPCTICVLKTMHSPMYHS